VAWTANWSAAAAGEPGNRRFNARRLELLHARGAGAQALLDDGALPEFSWRTLPRCAQATGASLPGAPRTSPNRARGDHRPPSIARWVINALNAPGGVRSWRDFEDSCSRPPGENVIRGPGESAGRRAPATISLRRSGPTAKGLPAGRSTPHPSHRCDPRGWHLPGEAPAHPTGENRCPSAPGATFALFSSQ